MESTGKRKTSRAKEKKILKAQRQIRILYFCLVFAIFCSLLWLIALGTDYWAYFQLPKPGVQLPSLQPGRCHASVLVSKMYFGMWRMCRIEWTNTSASLESSNNCTAASAAETDDDNEFSTQQPTPQSSTLAKNSFCTRLSFYPSPELFKSEGLDSVLLDYRRAVTGMAMIGLIMSVVTNVFTFYSVRNPRYVLRRLAGCLQIGTGACLLVCIEIFSGALNHARNLPLVYPPQTVHTSYGFSYGLAWFCFGGFLLVGIVLLFNSRKEKDTDRDQPVLLGRI